MRCTNCGSTHVFQNQSLTACREKVCERCGIKLTVTGSEGQSDPPTVPARELVYLTNKEQETAKRLLERAFEEKE